MSRAKRRRDFALGGAEGPLVGSPSRFPSTSAALAAALAPGFEAACYGEADGVRVVLLDAPGRSDGIELALRTSAPPVQTVAFPTSATGPIIRALLCAIADLGEVDRLIREEMEHRVVLDGARPVN